VLALNLLKYELFSRWGVILGWGLGLGLFGIMYVAIYPQFEDKMAVLSEIPFYKAIGIDLGSFEGFIASSLVLNVPVILAIYVIVSSTDTLSGEEDKGTLELIVTMPLKRWQIVTTKAIALTVVTFVVLMITGVTSAVTLIWVKQSVDVNVSTSELFVAVMSCMPITLVFLMIGLFFSAWLPNRKTAATAATTVFLVSYFAEILAGIVPALDVIRPFLLFHYFDSGATVFFIGVQARDVWTLLVIAAIFFVLALVSFQHRDITVGRWPWQRAKTGDTLT